VQLEDGWVWGSLDLIPIVLCLSLCLLRLPSGFPGLEDLLLFVGYWAGWVDLLDPVSPFLRPFPSLLCYGNISGNLPHFSIPDLQDRNGHFNSHFPSAYKCLLFFKYKIVTYN
jgi:hypothetical protein